MLATQKRLFFSIGLIFAVIVSSFSLTLLNHQRVYADYTVNADQKCQNGSNPTPSIGAGGVQIFNCAENTRTGTNQQTNNGNATDQGGAQQQASDDDSVTCAVEKIGWILCPIMEGAAKISDKAFDILADNFLRTDPELVRDDSGTKVGWEVARNLANIMFIISFLIIIFSQVTGRGLTNYGVKKMLPRLIIAAIAVNVSYYICQLAVDITNILGYEIQNAMAQIANTVGPSVFGQVGHADTQVANTGVLQHGGILALIVTSALAAGVIVWFMLPTIAALIPLILITVATIIIILLLRKAFIVLLIVISPIAFVMYLLPNTERFFSKWLKMFTQLLMVFPIVGLLFGAGQLASTIILVAGSDNGQAQKAASCNPDNEGDRLEFNNNKSANDNALCGEPSITVQGGKNGNNACFSGSSECNVNKPSTATLTTGLVATGIAVAPLLAVWAVLKGALSAAGAIGGKLSGAIEKGVRGGVNGGVGGGKKAWEASAFGRGQALRKQRKDAYKNERFLEGLGDPSEAKGYEKRRRQFTRIAAGGIAGNVPNLNVGSLQAQRDALAKGAAAGQALKDKRVAEEVQAASLKTRDMSPDKLHEIVDKADGTKDVNDPMVAAAIQELAKQQDFGGLEKAINKFANSGVNLASRTLSGSISQNNPGLFTAGQLGAMSIGDLQSTNPSFAGENAYASMVTKNIEDNILSAEKMAETGPSTLAEASRLATSQQAKQALIDAAHNAATDPILSKKIGRNGTQINNLRQGKDAGTGASWIP